MLVTKWVLFEVWKLLWKWNWKEKSGGNPLEDKNMFNLGQKRLDKIRNPITVFVKSRQLYQVNLDIWLAVHRSIPFLLLPTWYTNFVFIHTNYIKLNSSTCFERNPLIIVHMQPLVSSLSTSDRLVQPLSSCTRQSLVESDDTKGCICTICVVDLLMMSGLRSKHVEEFNLM
jgi:hypothetical protein